MRERLYVGIGPLNRGVIGRLYRDHGDILLVEVVEPGPTRYLRGQLLGARRNDWQEVEIGESEMDSVRSSGQSGDLGARAGRGDRVRRAGDDRPGRRP